MVPSNRALKHIQNQLWSISLKVLAFTIFLNTIDLSTDFAQSYLLYQDPALIEYGIPMMSCEESAIFFVSQILQVFPTLD